VAVHRRPAARWQKNRLRPRDRQRSAADRARRSALEPPRIVHTSRAKRLPLQHLPSGSCFASERCEESQKISFSKARRGPQAHRPGRQLPERGNETGCRTRPSSTRSRIRSRPAGGTY
jgi:hypothetical protein